MKRLAHAAAALAVAAWPCRATAATCESLLSLSLADTTITKAEIVAAGAFTPPPSPRAPAGRGGNVFASLPPFCRVAATLTPSSDSDITIEVWLPASADGAGGWNGKYQAVGNGAWAGVISYPAMANALRSGYATSSTDTGHVGNTARFALGHPEKLVDYAWRSEHEMTVTAKAIIAAFYGRAPARAYFNGCSTGGRQALVEAQRFPADFDGIIAGAAANPKTGLDAWRLWMWQKAVRHEDERIPESKYRLIHDAVLNACDAIDGVKDGLIENPTACHFDPQPLVCKNGDQPDCLTRKQAESVRTVLSPATIARTGKVVFPGYSPGAELGWKLLIGGPEPHNVAVDQFRYIVFGNPQWDERTFELERDLAAAEKAAKGTLEAVSPDLSAFAARGGKLVMYHGWSDQDVPPLASVNYYSKIPSRARDNVRLFMVPGMAHCAGGEGPNTFDAMTPLDAWVEHGTAPARIVASHRTAGAVDRTRPLCPYPQQARYNGTGDINVADNFICAK